MAWDIRQMQYLGINVGLGAVNPIGMAFKPDGTHVFIVDAADNKVKDYVMSSANNISTATPASKEFQLEATAQGLDFKPDGTVMIYVVGQTVKTRTLGTPWDVTTAGAASTLDISLSLASTDPQDVRFGDSGNKLFFTDDNDLSVHLYDLGTAYSITTGVYNAAKVLNLSGRFPYGDGLIGLYFKTDGTKIFVGVGFDQGATQFQTQTPAIREFSMSTAWDLGTATEITSEDANAGALISFMPHFFSGSYDWIMDRDHKDTSGTITFGEVGQAILIASPVGTEGGMRWETDLAGNNTFWNNLNDATWEGRLRFTRRPDDASLGGDNRLIVGSDDSVVAPTGAPLARPWSLVWNDVSEAFGLMAAGTGIQVSAGSEGGDWHYGEFLDWAVQKEGNDFHFWLKGKYYGKRTTVHSNNVDNNAFAYGKVGSIPGWDFASGVNPVWFRSYSTKIFSSYADYDPTTRPVDMTALNVIGRSIASETGNGSTATYIGFSADGGFVYAASNDTTGVAGARGIYEYNLAVNIPSCTGDGFQEYVEGGTVRLHVTSVSGAHHLEGETVTMVADGALHEVAIVNGQPQFPAGVSAAHVQVGHPYTADLLTLPIDTNQGELAGKEKAVRELILKFYKSVMPLIGPNEDKLVQMKHPEKYDFDEPLPLFTGEVAQRLERDWNKDGQVLIRMKDPYPITVVAAIPDIPETEDD